MFRSPGPTATASRSRRPSSSTAACSRSASSTRSTTSRPRRGSCTPTRASCAPIPRSNDRCSRSRASRSAARRSTTATKYRKLDIDEIRTSATLGAGDERLDRRHAAPLRERDHSGPRAHLHLHAARAGPSVPARRAGTRRSGRSQQHWHDQGDRVRRPEAAEAARHVAPGAEPRRRLRRPHAAVAAAVLAARPRALLRAELGPGHHPRHVPAQAHVLSAVGKGRPLDGAYACARAAHEGPAGNLQGRPHASSARRRWSCTSRRR